MPTTTAAGRARGLSRSIWKSLRVAVAVCELAMRWACSQSRLLRMDNGRPVYHHALAPSPARRIHATRGLPLLNTVVRHSVSTVTKFRMTLNIAGPVSVPFPHAFGRLPAAQAWLWARDTVVVPAKSVAQLGGWALFCATPQLNWSVSESTPLVDGRSAIALPLHNDWAQGLCNSRLKSNHLCWLIFAHLC